MTDKKIALITGAAKGIGKSIAERFKDDGYFSLLIDVDEQNGQQLEEELGNQHARFIRTDISNEKEVTALFEMIANDYGKLDALINNAGIIRDKMIWKMPVEDFDLVIQINLRGTWLMCRAAGTMMREQKSGRIVNIASRAWLGNRGQSNYAASKAGVVSLTRVLALELGKYGVCVNAVAPGLIDTPLTQALPEHVQQKLIEAQPTKTMGKPEDVANMVAFLASENTQFVTGQTIYVDGGKSIGAGI